MQKIPGENKKSNLQLNYPPPPPPNCAIYEIMWKNMEQPQRPQMTSYNACTLNAGYLKLQITDIHSDYIILIALPQPQ